MKRFSQLLTFILVVAAMTSAAPSTSMLPASFAGWHQDPLSVHRSSDAFTADATNAPVLKEYGFQNLETASYTRDGGRKLTIRAARFNDATGAYGAFTFYRDPEMFTETIGDAAVVSNGNRVLFFKGNILIDAAFDRVTAMSAAELRELASQLPAPPPNLSHIPDLQRYLPRESLVANSAKYVIGPAAYEQLQPVIPTSAVDFGRSAEVATGRYKTSDGQGTLTLIYYPTPQIAANQLRAFQQLHPAGSSDSPPVEMKRTGPIVAIASGPISNGDAKDLLASVNYEAEVTYNEPTFLSKRDNIGNLIVGVFTLIGVILVLALVLGVGFGGFRVLMKKFYPDKVFDRDEDVGFISLNLRK
jgi:uncharacterized protein DUF6599